MKIISTFKHLEHTPALDEKIHAKSQKLKKFFDGNFEVRWTCSIADDGSHCAEIKLKGPSFDYHATSSSETMYKSLDLVLNKIEKQVSKKKDKLRNKVSNKHKSSIKEQLIVEGEKDEDFWENKEINLNLG